jgi:hypothetical protein
VASFIWITSLGKFVTMDNLCKRHVIVMDWSYVYKKSGETPYHIFFTLILQNSCKIWFFRWLEQSGLVELLACWK